MTISSGQTITGNGNDLTNMVIEYGNSSIGSAFGPEIFDQGNCWQDRTPNEMAPAKGFGITTNDEPVIIYDDRQIRGFSYRKVVIFEDHVDWLKENLVTIEAAMREGTHPEIMYYKRM
jgi:hypothetical protein